MSSIAFHSREETVRIGGRERAYFGLFVDKIFNALLDLDGLKICCSEKERHKLESIVGTTDYKIHTLFMDQFEVEGEKWNLFDCALNTVLRIGSDTSKFIARVHAQCEIHGYVLGPNRKWLSDIIERGLEDRVLRKETQGYGKGLEDLIVMLRKTDEGPVVMSYSVCDSFPPWNHEKDEKGTFEEGMKWLLENYEESGLEMTPDDWDTFHFTDGRTAFDLRRKLRDVMSNG